MTSLIFPKNQRQCASFSINVAILFLSFKRATTVPNKLIDSQHYKRPRMRTLTTFYLLLHFTLATMRLNLSFLTTLNYSKSIQRLALSFSPLILFKRDKNIGNFLVRRSFQTNVKRSGEVGNDRYLGLNEHRLSRNRQGIIQRILHHYLYCSRRIPI